jgi:tetratricopeptide (TPR) repeat protein
MSFPGNRSTIALLVVALLVVSPAWGKGKGNGKKADKTQKADEPEDGEAADKPRKKHSPEFRAGAKAFKAKKYAKAMAYFEKAFEQEGSKAALFAWAQAQRLGGKCGQAYFNYSRLLRLNPTAEQLEPVQYGMRACEKILGKDQVAKIRARLDEIEKRAKERDKQEALRRQREELERQRRLEEEERQRRREADRRERDKTLALLKDDEPASRVPAYVLMISGGVIALAGGGALYLAHDYEGRSAETYQEQLDNNDSAETWNLLSTIGLASGGGLLAAGLIYWLATSEAEPEERSVVFGSGPGDLGLAIGGRF